MSIRPLSGLASPLGIVLSATICAVILFSIAPPSSANHRRGRGSIRHSRDYHRSEQRIEIRDLDALRLQREAIAAKEEAIREQGRKVRRDEIEKTLKEAEIEYLDYQEEVRAASRAARRAPRGLYYRRPGTDVALLPGGHEVIHVGTVTYYYFSGVFYRAAPDGYYVVTAPQGAETKILPEGHLTLLHEGEAYHYYFGTFYRKSEKGFRTVDPPPGIVVPYIPDGYDTMHVDGILHYRFGDVHYRPYYSEGVVVYTVVEG